MVSKFDGIARRGKTINVAGQEILLKPIVSDIEPFMTGENKKMLPSIVSMIQRGDPESKREDVEAFVAQNIGELILKVSVALGFVTEEEVKAKLEKKV